jgi:4a-hydroxytetrahydrobiopterin dehydratase
VKTPTRAELLADRCRQVGAPARMSDAELDAHLAQLPGWGVVDGAIERSFEFADFHRTMAFVNALAWVSHREDHHPELTVGYNKCHVEYTTHSINGLSLNDSICAAKVDTLFRI